MISASSTRKPVMMNSSDSSPNSPEKWKELYTSALLEIDDSKALERIAVARVAIVERMEDWQRGHTGEYVEATALQDALHSLRCLENIILRKI